MSIHAIVTRKRKKRKGKGFNLEELKKAGLSFKQALTLPIPIDVRRSTTHEENVKTLKTFINRYQKQVKPRTKVVVDLSEVKGIGPKLSRKLKNAGIKNANKLASSTPKKIAQIIGSSEERTLKMIEHARSLIKEKG